METTHSNSRLLILDSEQFTWYLDNTALESLEKHVQYSTSLGLATWFTFRLNGLNHATWLLLNDEIKEFEHLKDIPIIKHIKLGKSLSKH